MVEMLNVIDQKRQAVRKRYRNKKRVKFVTANCKPILWNGYKNMVLEMDTMRNQKARELKIIYDSLMNYNVTYGERMEILTMLKKSLEMHNCVPAFNLIRLLDQELTYLAKGIKNMSLDYFREKIICKKKKKKYIFLPAKFKFEIRKSLIKFFFFLPL